MSEITHIFVTEDEVDAFMKGVEWVNDSAIELSGYGPLDDGHGYAVVYEDADGDEDVTHDYRKDIPARLAYLRGEIEAERISYSEIAELQLLAKYIDPGDMVLRQWAGIPESELRALDGNR